MDFEVEISFNLGCFGLLLKGRVKLKLLIVNICKRMGKKDRGELRDLCKLGRNV